jgi:hypothetical protein
MKRKIPIKQLLRWHLAQAVAAAAPAPRARRLLEASRQWWEARPEHYRALAEQLGRINIASGDAVAKPKASNGGHPVPLLMILRAENLETSARIIYLNVRDSRLRMRFRLKSINSEGLQGFEVTFVDSQLRPLFSAVATSLKNKEYCLDVELRAPLDRDWEQLKVKDQMPFRLMLHPSEAKA